MEPLSRYEPLRVHIEMCNHLVSDILSSSSIDEARIAFESFSNGGKRLRPALLIISSCLAGRKDLDRVEAPLLELAGAIELIHLATLFHDDVIDGVEQRRGKMSARRKYGNYAAVLAGDFALAEALALVSGSDYHHTLPEFLRTIRTLVRGESKETKHKFDFEMNEAAYFEIISEKSASLFALSCKAPALAYRSNRADTLGHLGWNLGMAFQMIDDLDDMLDMPNGTGDCDLKNGYLSLPVISALGTLEDGHREGLIKVIGNGSFSQENERYLVSLLDRLGCFSAAGEAIGLHLDHAGDILAGFESGPAKELLSAILADLRSYSQRRIRNYSSFASG